MKRNTGEKRRLGIPERAEFQRNKKQKLQEDGRAAGPQGKWHILEHITKSLTEHLEGIRDAVKKASASSTKKNERQKTKSCCKTVRFQHSQNTTCHDCSN